MRTSVLKRAGVFVDEINSHGRQAQVAGFRRREQIYFSTDIQNLYSLDGVGRWRCLVGLMVMVMKCTIPGRCSSQAITSEEPSRWLRGESNGAKDNKIEDNVSVEFTNANIIFSGTVSLSVSGPPSGLQGGSPYMFCIEDHSSVLDLFC